MLIKIRPYYVRPLLPRVIANFKGQAVMPMVRPFDVCVCESDRHQSIEKTFLYESIKQSTPFFSQIVFFFQKKSYLKYNYITENTLQQQQNLNFLYINILNSLPLNQIPLINFCKKKSYQFKYVKYCTYINDQITRCKAYY